MDDITFVPALSYRDPKAALDWLAGAFGFELTMAIDGPDGDATQGHYEMAFEGRGRIMVGAEWNEWMRSPASVEGHTTEQRPLVRKAAVAFGRVRGDALLRGQSRELILRLADELWKI